MDYFNSKQRLEKTSHKKYTSKLVDKDVLIFCHHYYLCSKITVRKFQNPMLLCIIGTFLDTSYCLVCICEINVHPNKTVFGIMD